MSKIAMEKVIVENFNISALFLFISCLAFIVTQILRSLAYENVIKSVSSQDDD